MEHYHTTYQKTICNQNEWEVFDKINKNGIVSTKSNYNGKVVNSSEIQNNLISNIFKQSKLHSDQTIIDNGHSSINNKSLSIISKELQLLQIEIFELKNLFGIFMKFENDQGINYNDAKLENITFLSWIETKRRLLFIVVLLLTALYVYIKYFYKNNI